MAAQVDRGSAADLFAKYDADGSNSIDAEELDLMLKECGHQPDPETAKQLLSDHVDGMDEGAHRSRSYTARFLCDVGVVRELSARMQSSAEMTET